jgi:hypothetical protein
MEMKQERKVKRWREYFSGAKDPFWKDLWIFGNGNCEF